METADSWAIAERSTREGMAPVLNILPERTEQNKDFEIDDLTPGQKKWSRGSRRCERWESRLFCIGGLLSGYEKRNILPGIIKNENIMCLDNNLRSDGIVGKNARWTHFAVSF